MPFWGSASTMERVKDEAALSRWTQIVYHLRRLRRLQRIWAQLGRDGYTKALWLDNVGSALGGLGWSALGALSGAWDSAPLNAPKGRPAQPAQSRPNDIRP